MVAVSDNQNNGKVILRSFVKSESFIRSLIIFLLTYIFILMQGWTSILLILIPLISFGFFLFMKSISIAKKNNVTKKIGLYYNPIGNEQKVANRLFFCTIIESILILTVGAESLHYPQLIDDFLILYVTAAVIIFIFSLYYVFHDMMYYASISIMLDTSNPEVRPDLMSIDDLAEVEPDLKNENAHSTQKFLSYLNVDKFSKLYSIIRLSFLILLVLWLVMAFLTWFELLPGLQIELPGSDLMGGVSLEVPFVIILILIIIPLLMIYGLKQVYDAINAFDRNKLDEIIADFDELEKKKIVKLLNYYTLESQSSRPSEV